MNYLILDYRRYEMLQHQSGWNRVVMMLDFVAHKMPGMSGYYGIIKDRTGVTISGQIVTKHQLDKALEKLKNDWNKAEKSTTQ